MRTAITVLQIRAMTQTLASALQRPRQRQALALWILALWIPWHPTSWSLARGSSAPCLVLTFLCQCLPVLMKIIHWPSPEVSVFCRTSREWSAYERTLSRRFDLGLLESRIQYRQSGPEHARKASSLDWRLRHWGAWHVAGGRWRAGCKVLQKEGWNCTGAATWRATRGVTALWLQAEQELQGHFAWANGF